MSKRYTFSVNMFLFAESDEEAKELAEAFAREIDMREDNKAKVVSLGEAPFGKTEYREIKI